MSVDAEAADIVYQSQIPMLMSGLNLTRQVLAKQEHIDEIRAINNPTTQVKITKDITRGFIN